MKFFALVLGILVLSGIAHAAQTEAPIVEPGIVPGDFWWPVDKFVDDLAGRFSDERRYQNALERAEELKQLTEEQPLAARESSDEAFRIYVGELNERRLENIERAREAYDESVERIKSRERRDIATEYGELSRVFAQNIRGIATDVDLSDDERVKAIRKAVEERKVQFQKSAARIRAQAEEQIRELRE